MYVCLLRGSISFVFVSFHILPGGFWSAKMAESQDFPGEDLLRGSAGTFHRDDAGRLSYLGANTFQEPQPGIVPIQEKKDVTFKIPKGSGPTHADACMERAVEMYCAQHSQLKDPETAQMCFMALEMGTFKDAVPILKKWLAEDRPPVATELQKLAPQRTWSVGIGTRVKFNNNVGKRQRGPIQCRSLNFDPPRLHFLFSDLVCVVRSRSCDHSCRDQEFLDSFGFFLISGFLVFGFSDFFSLNFFQNN